MLLNRKSMKIVTFAVRNGKASITDNFVQVSYDYRRSVHVFDCRLKILTYNCRSSDHTEMSIKNTFKCGERRK